MHRITKILLADKVGVLLAGVFAFAALWTLLLSDRAADLLSSGVVVWWTILCALGVVNVCGWSLSALAVARRRSGADPAVHRFQRTQLLLSAVYVFGCGFRSILPRVDVQRMGLFDSWASSILIGRTVATAAEICFMAQWALLLYYLARAQGARRGVAVSLLLVPLIVVAEINSWYAVLTTCFLGHVIEESLWALCVSLLIVACLPLWPRCRGSWRVFLAAVTVLGVAYVTFMCTVDIPMYVSRWLADEASGRPYLSLSQGLWDVQTHWNVTFAWEEWRTEIPWMTLYFSVGVWSSLALVHAPSFEPDPKVLPVGIPALLRAPSVSA
jgi:hypothetical protein